MVNHFRNLLLNIAGNQAPGRLYPGEQYVPAQFAAKQLPQPLASARRLLVGSAPDRAMLNWRLQEILSTIYGCGLEQYVTALDPRVTYWPFNSSLIEKLLLGAAATKEAGATNQSLYFVGNNQSGATVDKLLYQWTLRVISSSTVAIVGPFGSATSNVSYTTSGGLSSIISLPDSDLRVRFDEGVGAAWSIEILTAPKVNLAAVMQAADDGLDDAAKRYLFSTLDEPYNTFHSLFTYHDQAPYRLAGLALATGYRINELPG